MPIFKAPLDDVRFNLTHVLHAESLWQSLPGLEETDKDTADAILEEAAKLCSQVLSPLNREADEEGCHWEEGNVITPEGFKDAYKTFCEGGWCGLGGSADYEGMGMPKTLVAAVEEMVQGANMSFGLAPMLTAGACLAIHKHASDALKQQYLPKLYRGEWSGAMDLTEPHCGTDLGLIRTKAVPLEDDAYAITGTKIFITWGEHDMAENIVHLVLAKLPDAPAGSKGISLFLVPKFLPDNAGNIGERNAVHCGSIEKKMGIKASATCVMNYDGAKGWLVGEPHQGLACMFTMMNYERLTVGIQGLAVAQVAYDNAVAYAKERLQGRSAEGVKQPDKEADNLLVHADVRRMLLDVRSMTEAGRTFYLYVAGWLDRAKYTHDPEEKRLAEDRIALLTPVTKAFLTDQAFDAAVQMQQVLGGHGFIREWGLEQCVRDIRITQIYEGTNGIQAMDLMGRKTVACRGRLVRSFTQEIREFITEHEDSQLPYLITLENAIGTLEACTEAVISYAEDSPHAIGSAAVDYLSLLGYVCYSYMWLKQLAGLEKAAVGNNADVGELSDAFVAGKHALAEYFFAKPFLHIETLKFKILAGDGVLRVQEDFF